MVFLGGLCYIALVKKRILLAILPFLIFSGCPRQNVKEPSVTRPYTLAITAEQVVEQLQQKKQAFQTPIKAEAKINIEAKEKRNLPPGSQTFEFQIARPGYVFLEGPVASGATPPLLYLATDGASFQYVDLRNEDRMVFMEGPAHPCSFEQLHSDIPLVLAPDQLTEVLLGSAPLLQTSLPPKISWDGSYASPGRDPGAEILVLQDEQGRMEKIWLAPFADGKVTDILKVEWYDNESQLPVWGVEHKKFETLKNAEARFPKETTFLLFRKEQLLKLNWKTRDLHPEIEGDWRGQFRIAPLERVPVQKISCTY